MCSASYRLSPIQEGMLFHHIQNPHTGVDIEQLVCSLSEAVNAEALRLACQSLVDRHAVLRTSLSWENLDRPVQSAQPDVEAPFELIDLTSLAPAARRERLEGFFEQDRIAGIRLDQAPLCRFTLFKLGASDFTLVVTFHHVAMDGRSFPKILNEIFAEYDARCEGKSIEFPRSRPYSDYLTFLDTVDPGKAESFWRDYLKGFVLPNQVPELDPPAARESGRGEEEIVLSEETTEALRAVAKREEVTLNTIVQGIWALMIGRYSASSDVVFGGIRACRGFASDTAEMVGAFINTLPVRIRIEGEEKVSAWLKGIRASQVAIRDYEHTPLASIQSWSEVPHGAALFASILVFDNYELNARMQAQGGNWAHREVRLRERTNFPLALYGYAEKKLILRLAHDQEHFSSASVRRMLGHMRTLLEALPAASERTLADLPMLTAEEREQLREWNKTEVDYPRTRTVHDLIEDQVDRSPDATAVVFRDQRLSYRELDHRANRLAHLLRSKGLQPGDRVAVSMERSQDLPVALLATLKAGGAYVPLDPTYPSERIKYVLADAQASIVITEEKLRPLVGNFARVVLAIDSDAARAALETSSQARPRVAMSSDSPAYVIYTSGSTGKPKGVVVNHRNAVNFFSGMDRPFGEENPGVWLAVTSISFDISVLELFWTLARGYRVVLQEDNQFLPANPDTAGAALAHPDNLLELAAGVNRPAPPRGYSIPEQILRHRVTHMQCTPSLARLLAGDAMGREALASLRKFLVGGEALPVSLAAELQQIGVGEIYNMYGPTETTIWSTMEKLPPHVQEISIGRPIANTSVFVLDSNRREVPVGVPGELYIGGEGVVPGYLDRPELTRERFVQLDFAGQRAYRTGDLVKYLPDGRLAFLGRIDHQVKIRGHRIEMGEIEAALAQHPGVQEAIVSAADHAEGSALVAYVVTRGAAALEPMDLRRFLETLLPSFMVPSAFVPLDAFPRTPNGKIDRKRLPRPELVPQQRPLVPPRNPVEEQLAKIWRDTLSISEVGIHDNFFELGGHSLTAVQVTGKIRASLVPAFPLRAILDHPTIARLSAEIDTLLAAAPQPGKVARPPIVRTPIVRKGAASGVAPLK